MVRDRLSEFQSRSAQHFTSPAPISSPIQNGNGHTAHPMEMNVSHLSYDTASRSQRFLQHVNELRESIDQLQRRISALHEKQANILSQTVVGPDDKKQLSTLIDEIKQHIRSLRPRVRRIEEDLCRDEADAPTEFRTGAELRIRRNQCEMLKLRLNDLLVLFNKAQLEYKHRVSKRVKRQLDLAGERVSATEVEQMLESRSQEIFYRNLNPTSYAAKVALEDATSRHDEILKLEQSINELNEVFRDLYDLVHSQSRIVDHIAKNVELATDFTRDAQVHVNKAVSYKKSANRNRCLIVLMVVVALLVVFAFAVVFLISIMPGTWKH